MNIKKQNIKYIAFLAAGIILIIVSLLYSLDAFWTGLGSAFLFISVVRLFEIKKYQTDPAYAKQVDISNHDERQAFVSEKAMVLTMKLVIYIFLAAGLLLYLMGQAQYGQFCMYGVCVIMILYLLSSYIVNKKY